MSGLIKLNHRLHLPGKIEESESAGGEYQADIASFVLRCPKKNPGENFEGLDMITKLLTPSGDTQVRANIEELDAENEEDAEEEEIDFFYEQSMPEQEQTMNITESTSEFGYGFNFAKTGVFKNLLDEFEQLLDVKNPDSKPLR